MNQTEYEKVKDFNYLNYCDYLQEKYGIGLCNYMTESWKKNPKVTRTRDGLTAHHKFEDHAVKLSSPDHAKNNPYEWQLAKNIVYCDHLEHLLLHILICEYPAPDHNDNEDVGYGGVVNYLVPELNDVFSGWVSELQWQRDCHNLIRNDENVYLCLLHRFINVRKDKIHEDPYCLYTSFNEMYGKSEKWSSKKNTRIFEIISSLINDVF